VFSFRILITGGSSGIVETITDAVSIHSIKKALYARRLAEGGLGHVTLLDHFKAVSTLLMIIETAFIAGRRTVIRLRPSSLGRNATSPSHWQVVEACSHRPLLLTEQQVIPL
jgi:hypothetical protein